MQRTVLLFILTVTGKFMPQDLLYQNRVPLTMCHKRIQGRYSMLELDEGKLSRPVLRRGVRGDSDSLADTAAARTLRTDTGTALDDGRVQVHSTGCLSSFGSLIMS